MPRREVRVSMILMNGSPFVRVAKDAATISASGVEWLTQFWRLEAICMGQNVEGPDSAIMTPDVDRMSCLDPAKSASENSVATRFGTSSPT